MTRLGQIRAVFLRDLRIQMSYPFAFIFQFTGIAFSLFSLFFLGELIGSSPFLAQYEGGYFEFALIGAVVLVLAGAAIRSFNMGLIQESNRGTLEILLASSTPLYALVLGWMIWPLALAALQGGLTFGIGWVLAGDSFQLSGVLVSLVPLVLTIATFLEIGLVAGAFNVVTKRGDPLTPLVLSASALVAGAVFPVAVLPHWLQVLARLFPAFYGFNAMRGVLIGNESLAQIAPEIAVLLAFNAVMLPLGMWLLKRSLRFARVMGTLATS